MASSNLRRNTQVAGTAEWVKGKAQGVWSSVVAGTAAGSHKTVEGVGTATSSVMDKVHVRVPCVFALMLLLFLNIDTDTNTDTNV